MKKLVALYLLLCFPLLNLWADYVVVGYSSEQDATASIHFPTGAITDISVTTLSYPFSVAAGRQVLFTTGNLQYQASDGEGGGDNWRIAEYQYTMLGSTAANLANNESTRATQTAWIDMFPYGCSGYNSGATRYQPWCYGAVNNNNQIINDHFLAQNLTGSKIEADWAYHNSIYCPHLDDNIPNHTLRVLTDAEWTYLLKTRTNASSLYGQARILISTSPDVYVNGLVILPDKCYSIYTAIKIHGSTPWVYSHSGSYADNTFTTDQWHDFETTFGAVFLPAAGAYERSGWNEIKHDPGTYGLYWSTTYNGSFKSKYMGFASSGIAHTGTSGGPGALESTRRGDNRLAVRAVLDYNYPTYTCTNCKNVTFTPPTAPSTEWHMTVNPGVGSFVDDIEWADNPSIEGLSRVYNRTNPSVADDFTVTFKRQKAIYASTDDLVPTITTDATGRGTVDVEEVDVATWPKSLRATPDDGYVFLRWDDGNVSNPREIATIEEAATKGYYTAYFAPIATSGDFTVDSRMFEWTKDYVYISTDAYDLSEVVDSVEISFQGTGTSTKGVKADSDRGIYRIPTGDISSKAGQTMNITYLDVCGNVITHTRGLTVPVLVEESTNASDLGLSTTSEVIVLPDATLTFDENTEISSLTIQAGAKAKIKSGVTLTADSLTMSANGIAGKEGVFPQLLVNGNILKKNDEENPIRINYEYALDYHKYYPLMLPYNVDTAKIMYKDGKHAVLDWDYEVKRYDGALRATGANGWINVKEGGKPNTFYATQGYDIFAVPQEWNGELRSKAVLCFPMLADLSSGESTKPMPVGLYDSGGWSNLDNWNLIGNPNLSGIHNLDEDDDVKELIAEDESKVRYITIPVNGFRNYEQVRIEDADVSPFNVFFIQAVSEGNLTIAAADRHLKAPKRQADEISELQELEAGITLTQGSRSDKTGILLGNAFTEEYDYNADLAKLFGTSSKLNVYSVINNTQLAFCALPYAKDGNGSTLPTTLSIGYSNASTDEDAVFAFDSKRYNSELLDALFLTDNYTGQTIDLLLADYTFKPLTKQDNERFALSAQPRRILDITTGLGATNINATAINGNGVYDLLGRKVCNSANAFRQMKQSVPAGIYIIIENGQLTKEIIR